MINKKEPKFIDITVSEGGFRVHHNVLPEQVGEIAKELDRSHIRYVEICHGIGAGSKDKHGIGLCKDKDLLISAKNAAPDLNYCVYFPQYPFSLKEIDNLQDYYSLGRVKINFDNPEGCFDHVKKLKALNKMVVAQLQRVHLSKPEDSAKAASILEDMGVDIIMLSDNFGSMSPTDVQDYLMAIKVKTKTPLGFHGRNYTDRAMINTLTAIEQGCEWIDASILGMGRGSGVTCLEVLISVLQRKNIRNDIDLLELSRAAKWNVLPSLKSLSRVRITDLCFSKYKIDYYPPELLERFSEILNTSLGSFLKSIRVKYPKTIQLDDSVLKKVLAEENLDWDVVMEFINTGEIPYQG